MQAATEVVQPCVCNSGPGLCCTTVKSAPTKDVGATEEQGVAAGTMSCVCQKSVQAAWGKGKACFNLSAKGYVCIPPALSERLSREEDACWEVQNWVKTLPDWLAVGIWFWFSFFSNSTFYSRYSFSR